MRLFPPSLAWMLGWSSELHTCTLLDCGVVTSWADWTLEACIYRVSLLKRRLHAPTRALGPENKQRCEGVGEPAVCLSPR